MKQTFALLLFTLMSLTNASVWHADNEWNESFEEEYEAWTKSDLVHKDLFVSKDSKYYGISADCADAAYALRAIFSRENSLPFAITNPSGSRGRDNAISNSTNAFDNHQDEVKRFVAFINYIGESVGSENLTRLDTYPVKIKSIKASSLFTYKIKGRFGKSIRHVYTIKNIQETGNFDLIYSTQAIKKDNLPMNYRKGKELVNAPHDVWGFKRFIWPRYLGKSATTYPESFGYSTEQFALAKQMKAEKFFYMVKETLQTTKETSNQVIKRSLESLCLEATARIKYVSQGVKYSKEINRCMNYTEYDTYSTPARDKSLKASFELLSRNFKRHENQITDASLESLTEDIFRRNAKNPRALLHFCSIKVNDSIELNLNQLWRRVKKGKLSSHPNDSLLSRWGEDKGRTKCKVWY
jgi:hypothetical protein